MTPRTCRLCPEEMPAGFPLCSACWEDFKLSGECRRLRAIMIEADYGPTYLSRQDGCITDYITRVLAERMHGSKP